MNEKAIEALCEITKVQSVAAGGFRVTLDIPSQYAKHVGWLLQEADKTGRVYRVEIGVHEEDED